MLELPGKQVSYWLNGESRPTYGSLNENITVDVIIVGGGIAGLTAAYLLKQSGQKVAVLEKNTIGSGTTGHTTGKVTSQHNLIYADLAQRLGEKAAKIYGEANQIAVERIACIIEKENIDCGWCKQDNFVYTTDPTRVSQFKKEAEAAARLGLPATFETESPLPFGVAGVVKFANQGYFHSIRYAQGLAALVNGEGSYVFEHSNVTSFRDGKSPNVKTKSGMVSAKDIIVATKMPASPLIARFACAALEYPQTSYIIACKSRSELKGMYISPDKQQYSILPVTFGEERLLLIGGLKHIPGLGNSRQRHQKLANYAEKQFGVSSVQYRWKGMDYLAYDDIPLIGKLYPWSRHIYVATGFMKWGLSNTMVAGMILHDLIMDNANPWASTFNSLRLKPVASIPHALVKFLH